MSLFTSDMLSCAWAGTWNLEPDSWSSIILCYSFPIDFFLIIGKLVKIVANTLLWQMKDYIATPKPNGYQSLHTTVIPFLYESMFRLEVQVGSGFCEALAPVFPLLCTSSRYISCNQIVTKYLSFILSKCLLLVTCWEFISGFSICFTDTNWRDGFDSWEGYCCSL